MNNTSSQFVVTSGNEYGTYITAGELIWKVDPDSVAQLVGHDSHDNEIYKGDTLIGGAGYIWTAEFLLPPNIENLTLSRD